jgi:hypothetical protein
MVLKLYGGLSVEGLLSNAFKSFGIEDKCSEDVASKISNGETVDGTLELFEALVQKLQDEQLKDKLLTIIENTKKYKNIILEMVSDTELKEQFYKTFLLKSSKSVFELFINILNKKFSLFALGKGLINAAPPLLLKNFFNDLLNFVNAAKKNPRETAEEISKLLKHLQKYFVSIHVIPIDELIKIMDDFDDLHESIENKDLNKFIEKVCEIGDKFE